MENIKEFKKTHYYGSDGKEISHEQVEKCCLDSNDYMTLDECAYQAAYDISNDWAKEAPEWKDVEEAYRRGSEDGINYAERVLTDLFKRLTKGTGLFKDDN